MPHPDAYRPSHTGTTVDSYKDVIGTFQSDVSNVDAQSAKTWSQPQAVRRVLEDTENSNQWDAFDVIFALVWRLDMEMDRSESLMKTLKQADDAARGKG